MIFTPVTLGGLRLPSRIVRSATELFCSLPDGHTNPFEAELYRELSDQPLGLVISAHTCVSPEGRSNHYQNAVWGDEFIPDAKAISDAIGTIPHIMQIGHGGMKAEGCNGGLPVYMPNNMTIGQIRETVKQFGCAAVRAKEAGFDGVMLHTAHSYLLSQFFYPEYNHRTDAYGGSAENRFRITRECIEEVKRAAGEDFPVFMKINGTDRNMTPEYEEDLVIALQIAQESGLAACEISGWNANPGGVPEKPYFIDVVRRLSQKVSLPLIEVGGIRSAKDVLDVLEAGAVAASVSRPLLYDPTFPSRLRDEPDYRSGCRGCGFCFRPLEETKMIRCAVRGK